MKKPFKRKLSLNTKWEDMKNETPEQINGFKEDVTTYQPPFFKKLCSFYQGKHEQDSALIAAITLISGLLCNIEGEYDNKLVEANLYSFVFAQGGVGKGTVQDLRALTVPIKRWLKEQHDDQLRSYKRKMAKYKKAQQEDDAEEVDEPTKPAPKYLIIPGNNSKSNIYKLLKDNGGRGIIYESEADTLSQATGQEFGQFSDIIRGAFHHETISIARKKDDEFYDIERPYLSIMLTGTPNQLKGFFRGIENGMFSRFMFFTMQSNPAFKSVFEKKANVIQPWLELQGEQLLALYQHLSQLEEKLTFRFSQEQEKAFMEYFTQLKTEYHSDYSAVLDGIINRMGLITFRVALVLHVMRLTYDTPDADLPSEMVCTDEDFICAISMVDTLLEHMVIACRVLLPQGVSNPLEDRAGRYENKAELIRRAQALNAKGLSYAAIARELLGNALLKATIFRWLNPKEK